MRRLQLAASGSTLTNEGIEDSLIDLAVYAIIALILYREKTQKPDPYQFDQTDAEWANEWLSGLNGTQTVSVLDRLGIDRASLTYFKDELG
jgi:hypothetical protein